MLLSSYINKSINTVHYMLSNFTIEVYHLDQVCHSLFQFLF